jgi:hypothetical protein
MELADLAHEHPLRFADVKQRLARLGIAEEDDEVNGMALAERHPDLRVVLESADAGAMARSRIDDDVRPPLRVDDDAFGRNDAHERIVDRSGKLAPVDDGLVVEVQNGRETRVRAFDEFVAAPANRVPEQDRALRGVDRVTAPVRPDARGGRRRFRERLRHSCRSPSAAAR